MEAKHCEYDFACLLFACMFCHSSPRYSFCSLHMLTIKALLRSLGEKLLDKADFDLKDYGDRGGFYTPRSKVQMDKSLLNLQRKPIRIPEYF